MKTLPTKPTSNYRSKKYLALFAFALGFAFSSCVRSDDPIECLQTMRIEPRWLATDPFDPNETLKMDIYSFAQGTRSTIDCNIYGVDVNLAYGNSMVVACEPLSNVALDTENRIVSVVSENGHMTAYPGIFSSGEATGDITPSPNERLIIPVPMYRQVRPLVIGFKLKGLGIPFIESVDGVLSGVALKRDMTNGFPPVDGQLRPAAIENGTAAYTFTKRDQLGEVWLFGSHNLIGIDGNASQELALRIMVNDTGVSAVSRAISEIDMTVDLTDQLDGYHTQTTNDAWYIVLNVNVGADFTITIEDWQSGPELTIPAK